MAQWLSWLERRPVTAEVESSSLFWVVSLIRVTLLRDNNFIAAAVAELADARDLKSSGWIVKLWRIFLEKSRNLKLHILQMCLHPSKTSLHFLRWFSWIRCTHICRCGGIGRRKGLKILRRVISVPVRVRPPALSKRD